MSLQRLAQRSIRFTQRQTHDFKLMLGRRTLHGLGTGLTTQYSSLYATLLGAIAIDLCVRLPLLAFTRETLHLQLDERGGFVETDGSN